MEGNFKKIVLIFICLMLTCCKNKDYEEHIQLLKEARLVEQHLIKEGRQLIQQNSNILIDSAFIFDHNRFDPKMKGEKPIIGLIDSVYYKLSGARYDKYLVTFKLSKVDLVNFKSDYTLQLVQNQNESPNGNPAENFLFYTFSDFRIIDNKASIDVKKNYGISMIKVTFFFEKINNVWVFRKKTVHGDIG
ncbi:MAG: hypothetical protein V4497_06475 [Bacteroidota bacterium]